MKKLFIIALLLIAIGGGITFGTWVGNIFPAHKTIEQGKTLSMQDQNTSPGVPRTISIPTLHVQATIESVGMDTAGRMDVPQDPQNAAWYRLGYKPGENGSAVLAGHLDLSSGAPAIFYNIKNLQAGDTILISDDKNNTLTFTVTKIVNYPYDSFPLQDVFGQNDKPMLNLITCEGKWNKNTQNYSHRTVVYSEMVQ